MSINKRIFTVWFINQLAQDRYGASGGACFVRAATITHGLARKVSFDHLQNENCEIALYTNEGDKTLQRLLDYSGNICNIVIRSYDMIYFTYDVLSVLLNQSDPRLYYPKVKNKRVMFCQIRKFS